MSDIDKRLKYSLGCDAINGDSFERSVVSCQIKEAITEISALRAQLAAKDKEIEKEFLINTGLSHRISQLKAELAEKDKEIERRKETQKHKEEVIGELNKWLSVRENECMLLSWDNTDLKEKLSKSEAELANSRLMSALLASDNLDKGDIDSAKSMLNTICNNQSVDIQRAHRYSELEAELSVLKTTYNQLFDATQGEIEARKKAEEELAALRDRMKPIEEVYQKHNGFADYHKVTFCYDQTCADFIPELIEAIRKAVGT